MTKLRISRDLALPDTTVTSTLVIYGGKGMGKTNLGSVLAEELTRAHMRWSWLDPLGVSWGLRHSADGKGPGISCLVLGGPHGDIPIEPTAGAIVADLVADEDVNTLIDFSRKPSGEMWSIGEKVRFITDYALQLFRRQGELVSGRRREPLFQILDEAARYIPQTIPHGNPEIARCVGAWEQIVEEGRNVSLGVGLLTQRSARMNKSVSELADAMFAFRTIGPNSLEAIMEWLGSHVAKERIRELVSTIRSLPVGRCLVVSPGWLGFEDVITIRRRETFDSSATLKAGQRSARVGKAASPDLAKYRERMAATIERAKAEDPKALRTELAATKRQLAQALAMTPKVVGAAKIERIEIPVLKNGALRDLKKISADWLRASEAMLRSEEAATARAATFRATAGDLAVAIKPLLAQLDRITSAPSAGATTGTRAAAVAPAVRAGRSAPPANSPGVPRARARGGTWERAQGDSAESPAPARTTEGITTRQQRFLDAAATLETLGVEATRETVAGWLGVHPRGGSFGEELKALADAGLITYGRGRVVVTDAGHASAGELPAHEAIDRATRGLSPRQTRIFEIVREAYPETITREAIAERMGIHARGGSFGEDLARLRGRGLIDYERGQVRARDFLFVGRA